MKMGDSVPEFLEKMLSSISNMGIKPKLILLDREFFSVEVIKAPDRHGMAYLMPCRNTHNVIAALRGFAHHSRTDTSPVDMVGQSGSAEYWMKIEERKSCKDTTKPEEKYVGFATNQLDVATTRYKERWNIETGYRQLEGMRARTRIDDMAARMLCFYHSLLLYNEWMMCRIILSICDESITLTQRTFEYLMNTDLRPEPEPTPECVGSSTFRLTD